MKTPSEIFKNKPELMENPEVRKLISEYEEDCDALIDLQQILEMGKEKFLKSCFGKSAKAFQWS